MSETNIQCFSILLNQVYNTQPLSLFESLDLGDTSFNFALKVSISPTPPPPGPYLIYSSFHVSPLPSPPFPQITLFSISHYSFIHSTILLFLPPSPTLPPSTSYSPFLHVLLSLPSRPTLPTFMSYSPPPRSLSLFPCSILPPSPSYSPSLPDLLSLHPRPTLPPFPSYICCIKLAGSTLHWVV